MTRDFTLEDIGKLINDSEARLENRLTQKFESSLNKFAEITMKRFDELDEKIDGVENSLRSEMRTGFRSLHVRIDMLEANHNARLEILEEKVL